MAVLCPDLYPTLFPHSPIDRQQGKWEQAFDAKIYGIVLVDSASNDQLSFWLPVNTTQTSAGFRPWVKGGEGRGSSRPWDKGEDRSPKNFFRPFGPQFHLKIRGVGSGPPGPSPGSPTANHPGNRCPKARTHLSLYKITKKRFRPILKNFDFSDKERVLELARIPVFWTIQQETRNSVLNFTGKA